MSLNQFLTACLPYCLKRQPDGKYVVLNREYKPVGFKTEEFITYKDYPISLEIKGLSSDIAAKLSCFGIPDLDTIQLYDDGHDPLSDAEKMECYLRRLKFLSKMEVS